MKYCPFFLLSFALLTPYYASAATAPTVTTNATGDHTPSLEHVIDCTALIAATASTLQGEITPNSPSFQRIGYGLGKAQAIAQSQHIPAATVQPRYTEQVIHYQQKFALNKTQTLHDTKAQHEDCLQQARFYDPATQVQALIEEAQKAPAPTHKK